MDTKEEKRRCLHEEKQDVMKYVGRSNSAPEHKAIKESHGKCSQLEK